MERDDPKPRVFGFVLRKGLPCSNQVPFEARAKTQTPPFELYDTSATSAVSPSPLKATLDPKIPLWYPDDGTKSG